MQIYDSKESGFWRPEKQHVLGFTVDDTRVVLRKFVSSNSPIDSNSEPDCSFASVVYGGSTGILAQLLELKAWFEDQTIFHFFSCSILMVYEKEAILKGMSSGAKINLIHFAHVLEGKVVIDHIFLGGLCALIKMISEILTSPEENPNKRCLQDYDKNHSYSENGTIE